VLSIDVSCNVLMQKYIQGFGWGSIIKPYTDQPK